MPVWGKLIMKIGIKMSVAMGGILAGFGLIGLGFANTLTEFYLISIPMGFGAGCTSLLPVGIMINNWFEKKKGLAMGISFAFSGVGGALFSPILASVIANHGWRTAYIILGIAFFLFTIPVAFFIRAHPSEEGLSPYGSSSSESEVILTGAPFNSVIKSKEFFTLVLSIILINAVGGSLQHLPAHLASAGIPAIKVGSIISVVMLILVASKVLFGMSNDKLGEARASAIFIIIFGTGMVMFSMSSNYTMAIMAAAVTGIGLPICSVLPALLTAKMFGQRDYSRIYSIIGMSTALGTAIGVPSYGAIFDKTGTYGPAFMGSAVFLVVAIGLIVFGLKRSGRLLTLQV
ncbi:MAG: MFS transporter, partial [Eudoraea sp.]|nr:MFS transporter [Eudoraea sp.]